MISNHLSIAPIATRDGSSPFGKLIELIRKGIFSEFPRALLSAAHRPISNSAISFSLLCDEVVPEEYEFPPPQPPQLEQEVLVELKAILLSLYNSI